MNCNRLIDTKNVLVLPSGTGNAICAIKRMKQLSLQKSVVVHTADIDELSAGRFLGDKFHKLEHRFEEEAFVDELDAVVDNNSIDLLLPTIDTILELVASRSFRCHVMVSPIETIRVTRDKLATQEMFPKHACHVEDPLGLDVRFPVVIKPRFGSGSLGVYIAKNPKELEFYTDITQNPIVQVLLPGKEYTVDCLSDSEGDLKIAIPRERIATKAGISVKTRVTENLYLVDTAVLISSRLRFNGLWFFQMKEDSSGMPKLTEINARMAGGMCAGTNLHELYLKMWLNEEIDWSKIVPKKETVVRYLEEIYT